MKYTWHGFNQQEACNLNLNLEELAALRWFIDFKSTEEMKKYIDKNGDIYYWVNYKYFAEQCPIFFKDKLNPSSSSVRNKVQRLFTGNLSKVLEKKIVKVTSSNNSGKIGTEMYFKIIPDTYKRLISDDIHNSKMSSAHNSKMSSDIHNSKMSSNYSINNYSIKDTTITRDGGHLSPNCPPKIEIDIKKDTTSNSDNLIINLNRYLEQRGFTTLSPTTLQKFITDVEIYGEAEVYKAIDISDENGKHSYSYVKGILERRKSNSDTNDNKKDGPTDYSFLKDIL